MSPLGGSLSIIARMKAERDAERASWAAAHPGLCVRCRDTGTLSGLGLDPCDACEKGATVMASRDLEAYHALMEASNIPTRFRAHTFDTYPSKGLEALKLMRGYAASYDGQRGVFLSGPVGTGKTGLAVATANMLAPRLAARDQRMYFTGSVEMLRALRPNDGPDDGREKLFRLLCSVRLLVLDDLGKDKPTEWVVEKIFELIDYRYTRNLSTIVTSNYDHGGLVERIGEAAADRLADIGAFYHVAMDKHAPNLRRGK